MVNVTKKVSSGIEITRDMIQTSIVQETRKGHRWVSIRVIAKGEKITFSNCVAETEIEAMIQEIMESFVLRLNAFYDYSFYPKY